VFRSRKSSAVEALHGEQVVDAGIDADLERILQISFGRNL
jgi:hypothetical protein